MNGQACLTVLTTSEVGGPSSDSSDGYITSRHSLLKRQPDEFVPTLPDWNGWFVRLCRVGKANLLRLCRAREAAASECLRAQTLDQHDSAAVP